MALTVHTNYANLVAQNTLNRTNDAFSTSLERLATGYRINSAADDAAGLQISNRLEMQSRGISVAQRNISDGISMLQTAEGALEEVTNIAYRMNDLALQSQNGTNSVADRKALDAEYQQLADEAFSILENTNYGGNNLFGTGGAFNGATVDFQIGTTSAEGLSVDVTNAGASTALADLKAFFDGVGGAGAIDTVANADTAAVALSQNALANTMIDNVGEIRALFGASINRLEHTSTNLSNMKENLDASKGRITDTDMASESAMLSKNQMLMQAGTQVLGQTKMVPQLALSLLG
ncbi:flagellin [Vibrio sp.]|nr:flagellin [Vibrio sp.]